jgi:hypothetical protein
MHLSISKNPFVLLDLYYDNLEYTESWTKFLIWSISQSTAFQNGIYDKFEQKEGNFYFERSIYFVDDYANLFLLNSLVSRSKSISPMIFSVSLSCFDSNFQSEFHPFDSFGTPVKDFSLNVSTVITPRSPFFYFIYQEAYVDNSIPIIKLFLDLQKNCLYHQNLIFLLRLIKIHSLKNKLMTIFLIILRNQSEKSPPESKQIFYFKWQLFLII